MINLAANGGTNSKFLFVITLEEFLKKINNFLILKKNINI